MSNSSNRDERQRQEQQQKQQQQQEERSLSTSYLDDKLSSVGKPAQSGAGSKDSKNTA